MDSKIKAKSRVRGVYSLSKSVDLCEYLKEIDTLKSIAVHKLNIFMDELKGLIYEYLEKYPGLECTNEYNIWSTFYNGESFFDKHIDDSVYIYKNGKELFVIECNCFYIKKFNGFREINPLNL